MKTYKDYAPTQFDPRGLNLPDQQGWLVAPCGINRDSLALEISNWEAQLAVLGGESDTCEIHRIGHWACGWLEILIIAPSRLVEGLALESRLGDYPVLDEEDWARREHEAALESWHSWGCREFSTALQSEFGLMDATADLLTASPFLTLHVFESSAPYSLVTEGDAVRVRACMGKTSITRDQLAHMLRKLKIEERK